MAEFTYVARDTKGERVTGEMSAATERDVISMLSGKSLFPVSVKSKSEGVDFGFGGGVNAKQIAVFYEQLSQLMSNGVPLLKSLAILRTQSSAKSLKAALDDVISRVEDGEPLGDAFAKHPKVFSDIAVNMSRAGAEGGFLEDALARVASFTQQQDELKSRTIGALIYPMVLATVGTTIVGVLLVYFVPMFGGLFDSMREKGALPPITEWLLSFSGVLQNYFLIFILLFVALYVVFKMQMRTEKGKLLADRVKLKLPLFGPVVKSLSVARFCRVLGTLLKNGVPILRALDISSEATGNKVLAAAISGATDNITAGEALSKPLADSGHFPNTVTEMISVAEESNTLDVVLVSIADSLENQTTRKLDLMVRLLEPLMLIVMAAIICVVVIALLLPIMKMSSALQ